VNKVKLISPNGKTESEVSESQADYLKSLDLKLAGDGTTNNETTETLGRIGLIKQAIKKMPVLLASLDPWTENQKPGVFDYLEDVLGFEITAEERDQDFAEID